MNTFTQSGILAVLARMMLLTALGASALHADAATILVSKGVIGAGTDTTGVFGGAAADLTGMNYKLMITYDDFSVAVHSSSPTFDKETGPMTGTVSVAVGGSTFAPDVTQSFGAFLYANNNGSFSEVTGFQSGNDAQGQNVYASNDLSSTAGTVTGPAIGLSFYTAQAGDIGAVTFSTGGPEGKASFTATPTAVYVVFPPAELIDTLAGYVRGTGLSKGIQTSLLAKLAAAQSYLAGGNIAAAIQAVTDFLNEVSAQSGKAITAGQAAEMTNQAQTVIAVIGVVYG
jgi:hypothetical protein